MILNWGDGGKFLDGHSMSFLGVEDYVTLGNVVFVTVHDDDSVSDVVNVLLSSLTVSVNDQDAAAEFVRVSMPVVVLAVDGAAAADVAVAAIRIMVHAVETTGGAEAVSIEFGTLLPVLINVSDTGLTPEEWVRLFIGIIAVVTSDVIPIEERRLALLRGFEDLYFDRAELLQTLMTDEALVE